jgi:histidinol-phosphate aminotransferase
MIPVDRLVSEGVKQITPYIPGKPIEELEKEYGVRDAIKMASNENPLGPSPKAIEAIKNCLSTIHRYPDANSLLLKEQLSKKLGVPQDCIIPSNGSNEILELLSKVFLRPGQEVIIPEPTFSLYAKFTQAMDGTPIRVPLKNFSIDLHAVLKKISPRTKIIFINNPNNPTGTIVKKGEFEEFLNNIPEDIIIVLDEAYAEFVENSDFPHGKNYLDARRWIITLRTFSKVYGLAGLRIGYGLASQALTHYLNKVRQPFNVNSLAQVAALAALGDNEHFDKTLRIVSDGRKYLYPQLDQLSVKYIPTQSNFIMIYLGEKCPGIYDALLRMGVIVRPLASFGFPEYIRLSIGTPEENKRFIKTLKKARFNNQ